MKGYIKTRIRQTTWAWGAEHKYKYQQKKLLQIGLNGHDIKFNASRFGIDQFEELISLARA